MAEFTLDTSGVVVVPTRDPAYIGERWMRWPDLDPFSQGYVGAGLEGAGALWADARHPGAWDHRAGFSDLAPETLAAILKDCEAVLMLMAHAAMKDSSAAGREFWARRQAGRYDRAIAPPLAAYLGDDGKVYLRETQS